MTMAEDSRGARRTAVVLFSLGGPDSLDAVEPFLFNLFSDAAILRVPQPLRWLLARLIARRRAPVARAIYAQIGGASPLLANTRTQADALTAALAPADVRVFTCMRYWHPRAAEVAAAVRAWAPDRIILLPLYPQFSTTTTASSVREWRNAARQVGLDAETVLRCCYPTLRGFVAAMAAAIQPALAAARREAPARLLFSAHGLPRKIVAAGDPYQWQVERTADAIRTALGESDLDSVVCYQSRVGPLAWIEPYTEDEIRRAGRDGRSIVVVPLAFVSEHSETLVELDLEYRELALHAGAKGYHRVATVGAHAAFIAGLAETVRSAMASPPGTASETGARLCGADWRGCPAGIAA